MSTVCVPGSCGGDRGRTGSHGIVATDDWELRCGCWEQKETGSSVGASALNCRAIFLHDPTLFLETGSLPLSHILTLLIRALTSFDSCPNSAATVPLLIGFFQGRRQYMHLFITHIGSIAPVSWPPTREVIYPPLFTVSLMKWSPAPPFSPFRGAALPKNPLSRRRLPVFPTYTTSWVWESGSSNAEPQQYRQRDRLERPWSQSCHLDSMTGLCLFHRGGPCIATRDAFLTRSAALKTNSNKEASQDTGWWWWGGLWYCL